jgi:histidine ammonia-lyase
MTVVVSGRGLRPAYVLRVAREREPVMLDPDAARRMQRARAVVEQVLAEGRPTYGLTTGVGVLKRVAVAAADSEVADATMLERHRVGLGSVAAADVTRATAVCLLNGLAAGFSAVRAETAEQLASMLNDDRLPPLPLLGSIGMADLAALAELASALGEEAPFGAGESLALIDNNAFATAIATLALYDAERLQEAMEVAGALAFEGFAANPSILHPANLEARPGLGLADVSRRLIALLEGSDNWSASRNLQDPLCYRCMPQVLGASLDAFAFAARRLDGELNGWQGNPIVAVEDGTCVPSGGFDSVALAQTLDLVRLSLASAITSSLERTLKLLDTMWSDLPTGLADGAEADPGLSILGIAAQASAGEARLLAQPVSFEVASTTLAEGIEDRMTMAPLAGRRLAEQVMLGEHVVAIELVVGARAVVARGAKRLGRGTRTAADRVGEAVEQAGGPPRAGVEAVVELIRSAAFGDRTSAVRTWS